jgi:hypothetical protein
MIQIEVKLDNDFITDYRVIEITREELQQYACNKARGMYQEGFYTRITADDVIKLTSGI